MLLTLQSCAQETGGLYDAMEKAVARSEVHRVSLTLYRHFHMLLLLEMLNYISTE